MQFIRRFSLVKRVMFGFSTMAAVVLAVGGAAGWALTLANSATAATAVGSLAVAGATVSMVMAWLIRSSINDSVSATVQAVGRIAGGDLETRVESPGKDEISWLNHELNSMRKKLRKAVLEVRATVESVNTASDEIASGNLDLSVRTESQAGALQQTSSTVQQLASTVSSNAKSTQEARSVVAQSNDVAVRGAQMMLDVVARMGEINASSSKISEIIGVIDGIAFQTNILALNAAVEAARAGDHGRGFAVVAAEVRNLAQRSSTAAREIKVLISDSSAKVELGSKLVDNAGRNMQDIVTSVKHVAGLITSIAEAGQSQSSDIGQVHQSISQIDTMTQQNAALVEQLAASAQSLKGQSIRLSESMSTFRVVA